MNRTQNVGNRRLIALGMFVVVLGMAQQALAAPIACRSNASVVKAVTDPDYHAITTKFQLIALTCSP
jgi:hypothetical protein